MRILLIQIRQDAILQHEYKAIMEKMQLRSSELISWNIFMSLTPPEPIETFQAILIGGSGAYCVSLWNIPQELEAITQVVRIAYARGIPVLGICFGCHLLAHIFGGEVQMDSFRQEVGTFEITSTTIATSDTLFSQLPKKFWAQEGHKDHVVRLPKGAIHLASSALSKYQAFRLSEGCLYGVQFHPELSKQDVLVRYQMYHQDYQKNQHDGFVSDAGSSDGQNDLNSLAMGICEAPDAERFLLLFKKNIGKKFF